MLITLNITDDNDDNNNHKITVYDSLIISIKIAIAINNQNDAFCFFI